MSDEQTTNNEQTPTQETPPAKGTPEYNAMMAQKCADLPEQFQGDPTKLLDAFKELQRKQSGQVNESSSNDTNNNAATETQTPASDKAGIQISSEPESKEPPITLDAVTEEFVANQKLSDETIAALKSQKNMTDGEVTQYVEGLKSQLQQATTIATTAVGGEEQLNAILNWAKSLPDEEKAGVNAALANPATMVTTLLGLKARMGNTDQPTQSSPAPTASSTVNARTAPSTQGNQGAYNDMTEVVSAMSDPKYKKDPTYRKEVEDKTKAMGKSQGMIRVKQGST